MGLYLGIFLISFATLALEVTLTRLLSVTTWYHLAFFAVSIAMLGMTAGAVTVFLRPGWFGKDRLDVSLSKTCLWFAAVVPISLLVLCATPIELGESARSYFNLLLAGLAGLVPFYFAGIAVSAVLTKGRLPIGNLYASDLTGASLGCLFVLGGLEIFSAPTLILLCGIMGVVTAVAFGGLRRSGRLAPAAFGIFAVLAGLVILDLATPYGIKPMVSKGRSLDPGKYVYEKWNSFSRILVQEKKVARPQYWGRSRLAPDEEVAQYKMTIDGSAATTVGEFREPADIEHLRFDATNVAYHLRPRGGALIVGVGGGRDIQSALLFGHRRIIGVDINPIFIDLLQTRFRDFAGIADREEVTLVADEARSYVSRSDEEFAVIQMSLTDTWAATGAGAFALSENTLYTVDAWKIFIRHLSDRGLFTVSRWYNPRELGETGRMVALAVATLAELGAAEPSGHLALVTSGGIATLLVGRSPMDPADIEALTETCDRFQFRLAMHPGKRPQNVILDRIVAARTREELDEAISGTSLNYAPPTDENPYFFNMLRANQVLPAVLSGPREERGSLAAITDGVSEGSVVATRTLIGLVGTLGVLSVLTVVFPLALRGRGRPADGPGILWPAAAYFALIGAGFMFVEIALIQRLAVFLGHPMYALGILLFTIIASAGAGSRLSEKLPLTRSPWVYVFPAAIAAAVLAIRFVLPQVATDMVSAPMSIKIPVSIAVIVPLGILLGFAFPTGMKLVRSARASETPWYWAINGVFGVLCAALTVFVSIYFGISTSFYVGAVCYGVLPAILPRMRVRYL
jgi:spermidine synthase